MNKKSILIVSATSGNNFILANKIHNCIDKESISSEILNLEDYCLPIFTQPYFNENNKDYLDIVKLITNKFIIADGIIICAPEYNGSIPPIVNNTIAWMSMSTKDWRDSFNDKIGLVCSSSGGEAAKFIISMKLQLEHLGMIVLSRNIIMNNSKEFNNKSVLKILKQFIKLL